MKFVVALLAVATLPMVFAQGSQAQPGNGLAFHRAEHLKRGINFGMWYAQTTDHSPEHYASYTTPADFALVKQLNFDHVRLSIDPEPLIAEPQMGSLRPDAMARLDNTLDQLLAAGLNVILDIHPEESWKTAMTKPDDGPAKFYAFWTSFAQHFAGRDPERVFFEVMNEPTVADLYRWQGIQAKAIERIRKVAPQQTILATASNYSNIEPLMQLEPVRDENVIYTFHYYTPFFFTHQGATWATQENVYLRGVPYPSTPDNVQGVIGQVPDDRSKLRIEQYGWDRWDAPRIGSEIAAMAEWAKHRDVPLYLGEFGVFRAYAQPEARATWISDVRTAAESKQIGWCMWDYQASFGLVTKSASGTVVDPAILRALGLGQPAAK